MYMQESARRAASESSRTCMHSTCMHVGLRISCLLASLNEGRAGRRKQICGETGGRLIFFTLFGISYIAHLHLLLPFSILHYILLRLYGIDLSTLLLILLQCSKWHVDWARRRITSWKFKSSIHSFLQLFLITYIFIIILNCTHLYDCFVLQQYRSIDRKRFALYMILISYNNACRIYCVLNDKCTQLHLKLTARVKTRFKENGVTVLLYVMCYFAKIAISLFIWYERGEISIFNFIHIYIYI